MGEIVSIIDRLKKPQLEKPTIEQLANDCSEDIAGDWERFARNNHLNEYFTRSTPMCAALGVDYLSDITALSVLEGKINLALTLLAPGVAGNAQIGWVANFKINGVVIATPFMPSEAYARAYNILLFLKLGRALTQNGIPIN